MRRHALLVVLLAVLGVAVWHLPALRAEPRAAIDGPAPRTGHVFHNLDPSYSYTMVERARHLLLRALEGSPPRGRAPAVVTNDGARLRANHTAATITWVGHATLLVQMGGVNILTDPHWGDRAAPLPFAGRRLIPPGLRFEDLPHIDAVVISHDHYDHLDLDTVLRLERAFHPRFFVPIGLREWLGDHGIGNVVELDWWETASYRGLTFVCTPAQHSSGRTLTDQNLRLWSSWVITGADRRFFFAGDTGYTPSLAEIGRRYGPFDLAAIPIGGYSAEAAHHPNHVNPEEAVQVFEDVRGRRFVPIHWGTFALNHEPFREPPERLMAEARRRGIESRIDLLAPGQSIDW